MKSFYLLTIFISLTGVYCKKDARPKSKVDYIPIVSANSPIQVTQGQPIQSRVKYGFYDHFADITFLNFEIKETSPMHYEIRARGFYENIVYGISLPVVMIADTTLTLQTPVVGKYILKFYSFNQLVETDSVQVN